MISWVLEKAVTRFGATPEHLQPLSGGNFSHVYEYSRDGDPCILRVTPPNEEIDAGSMLAILAWQNLLSVHGAPVAKPILSSEGRLLETVEQDGETYLVTSFEKASGILAEELPFSSWDETLVQKLGAAAGKMHAIARGYNPASQATQRPAWDQAENCYNPSGPLDPAQAGVREARSKILDIVRDLPKDQESYGLIHADFHGGNFFVDVEDQSITVFDFDDCCYGWYAMDIAMSLFDILVLYPGGDPQRFGSWFLENYLMGYSVNNSLSPASIERLPLFLKLLETGVYIQVHRFYEESGADTWVGKFMAGRRKRIEGEVPYVDLDFTGIHKRALANSILPTG